MEHRILFMTAIVALFQFLFKDCAGEAIDELSKNSKRKQFNNLTCFVCHSEKDKDCLKMDDIEVDEYNKFSQACATNETYCTVKRISFTASQGGNTTQPMKTVAMKRNCTQRCDPGCVIMGERTRLYVCSSCCQNQLCNTGNGASSNFSTLNFPIIMFKFIVFLISLRAATS